jgi:hypothetical protein
MFGHSRSLPIPMAVRSKAWVCGRSLAEIVGSNPAGGNACLSFECCVLSGRCLCEELITRPEESYRLWCVWVWTRNLINEEAVGCCVKQIYSLFYNTKYCKVSMQSLEILACRLPVILTFRGHWLRHAPTSLTFNNCTLCPHCVCVLCIYLRTNCDLCYFHHNWLVFITEMKSVYSAVRPGSVHKAVCASSLKG